jgi:hypothetical protein
LFAVVLAVAFAVGGGMQMSLASCQPHSQSASAHGLDHGGHAPDQDTQSAPALSLDMACCVASLPEASACLLVEAISQPVHFRLGKERLPQGRTLLPEPLPPRFVV